MFEKLSHTAGTRLAGDPWNLKRKKSNKDVRAYSFSQRIVDPWNNLPPAIKQLETKASFKSNLKKMAI